jgi:hypothetical protein
MTKQPVISLLSSDDKENTEVGNTGAPATVQEGGNKSSQPKLTEPVKKDVPSTPAGRLALTDLIGMGDVKRAVQDISPEDRIEWDVMSSNPGKTRARKRARSSSPLTSPPGQLAAFISSKAQVDPGSEIWGRYSLNGSNAPTPQASVPALAYIMCTSSPQTSKESTTPRSGGGFRRANSCGNQFPKRRRVGGTENDDVFTESVSIGPSKLSVLLERVQEGLTRPIQHKESPHISRRDATSSKLPAKRRYEDFEDITPIEQDRMEEVMAAPNLPPPVSETKMPASKQQPQIRSNSSDYGEFDDDDLDASLLDVFLSQPEPVCDTNHGSAAARLPPDPPPQPLASTGRNSQLCPAVKGSKSSNSSTLKDEFDDSDEDMFAADLEDIVAKFDTQNSASGNALPASKEIQGISKADSDDEFGDGGLDEEDFEAAEVAATQSIQQTANGLLPVRAKFP